EPCRSGVRIKPQRFAEFGDGVAIGRLGLLSEDGAEREMRSGRFGMIGGELPESLDRFWEVAAFGVGDTEGGPERYGFVSRRRELQRFLEDGDSIVEFLLRREDAREINGSIG